MLFLLKFITIFFSFIFYISFSESRTTIEFDGENVIV